MAELIYLPSGLTLDQMVNSILEDPELQNSGLTPDKVNQTVTYFGGDRLASVVFLKKYALRNNENQLLELTPLESFKRWATAVSAEDFGSLPIEYEELYHYFLPGGRQMLALGNPYLGKATLNNCYTHVIPEDSLEGIFEAAYVIAKTFSYGGGQGLDIGVLRPGGATVSNTAKTSTGAVSFMKLYSTITGVIGQYGRRGALMISCPVNHPDIENFIKIKQETKDVEFANISVKITDDFMRAIETNSPFTLSFRTKHELIERAIKAKELWESLCTVACETGDPGLLFWDRIREWSPSEIYQSLEIVGVNPCSEIPLSNNEACCLGSLLLHKFIDNPFTPEASFNSVLFEKMVAMAVRHLDTVVSIGAKHHPLKEQQEKTLLGRRIGLGITGLADMLLSMNMKYDSPEAIEFVSNLMDLKRETEYKASIELALEKGMFPLCNREKHYDQMFTKGLSSYVIHNGKRYGQRNVAISTVAPSGSISVIAQCLTGDTLIHTLNGQIPIKELIGKEPLIYCCDNKRIHIRKARDIRLTGGSVPVFRVEFDTGSWLTGTIDHPVQLSNGSYKAIGDLELGDSIRAFSRTLEYSKDSLPTIQLNATNLRRVTEHRAVAEFSIKRLLKEKEEVHYKNKDRLDNLPDNLEVYKNHTEHMKIHKFTHLAKWSQSNRGKTYEEIYGAERGASIREQKSIQTSGEKNPLYGQQLSEERKKLISQRVKTAMWKPEIRERFLAGQIKKKQNRLKQVENHKVLRVVSAGNADVFNLEVDEFHNFVANGIFTHNCSSGIEPHYDLSYTRAVLLGSKRVEFEVIEPGVTRLVQTTGIKDPENYVVPAHKVDWKQRIHMQATIQKYVDSSISSTINLPKGTKPGLIGEIYGEAWKQGLKGITVYVDGSKKAILENRKHQVVGDTVCYKFSAEGADKFYIHISYMGGDKSKPYQIFSTNYKATEKDKFIKLTNELRKLLTEKGVNKSILKQEETTEQKIEQQVDRSKNTLDKLMRFLSLTFKSGYLDEVLTILNNHAFVGSLAWRLKRILSYKETEQACPQCGGRLIAKEGCYECFDCGYNKCG